MRVLFVFILVALISGCAAFTSINSTRFDKTLDGVSSEFVVIISEAPSKHTLSSKQIDHLLNVLESEHLIKNVYYNETPLKDDLVNSKIFIVDIKNVFDGMVGKDDEMAFLAASVMMTLGVIPIWHSWEEHFELVFKPYSGNGFGASNSAKIELESTQLLSFWGAIAYPFQTSREKYPEAIAQEVRKYIYQNY